MATRFKSVIAFLAAVVVVGTSACAGDPVSEINWADRGNSKMHDKIAADTRAFRVGELELAIQDYDKVIQLDPNDPMAYISRGFSSYRSDSYQQAIQDFDKAIQLDPYDSLLLAMAYDGRGRTYHKLGQRAKAAADKAKAYSLDNLYC